MELNFKKNLKNNIIQEQGQQRMYNTIVDKKNFNNMYNTYFVTITHKVFKFFK